MGRTSWPASLCVTDRLRNPRARGEPAAKDRPCHSTIRSRGSGRNPRMVETSSSRVRVARAWSAIPPDERIALFTSLAATLGIPLFLVLVLDPMGALLRPLRFWLFFLGLPVWVLGRVLLRWALGWHVILLSFGLALLPV